MADMARATPPYIEATPTCSRAKAGCSALELDTQVMGTSRTAMATDSITEAALLYASMADRAITSHPTAPFTCLSGTGIIERGTVPGTASHWRAGEQVRKPFNKAKTLKHKAEA